MIRSQAIGPHEAAAILGVHYTVPARMVAKGLLSSVYMKPRGGRDTRDTLAYDAAECDRNYHEYEAAMADRRKSGGGRPRSWVHTRPDMLRHLASLEVRIGFSDAISIQEAADIMRVHASFVPRMIESGEIVGRRAWGRAGRGGKIYLISRASCLANLADARKKASEGGHPGRPRRLS
jgi:hypothetical protein